MKTDKDLGDTEVGQLDIISKDGNDVNGKVNTTFTAWSYTVVLLLLCF